MRQTANKIVQAINADTDLQAIGVIATVQNGANYTIASTSANGTLYKQTTTGGGSNRLAIQQTLTIGGTVTVGDKVTLTIYDAGLVGGKEVVAYKPVAGDTTATIVTKLRNKINNSTTLAPLGIVAKVSSADANVLLIESPTFDATEKLTGYSAKTSAGATETVAVGAFWGTNGAQTLSVTGPVTVGETVKFTVFNPDLPDLQKEVSYVVQAGDNLNKIRCGLRTEVNNDADLAEIGIHATCGGGILTVTNTSPDPTDYLLLQLVVCTPIDSSPTKWPAANQVKICRGAALDSALQVRSTVEALGDPTSIPQHVPYAAVLLSANSNIVFYVYRNHGDFYDSGTGISPAGGGPSTGSVLDVMIHQWSFPPYVSVRSKILGFSVGDQLSLIFENTADPFESGSIPDNYIKHSTAHEFGHQFAFLARSGGKKLDESTAFQNAWAKDMEFMHRASACRYNAPLYQTNPPQTEVRAGIFTNAKGADGQYICGSDGQGFGGGDPVALLQSKYPYFSDPNIPLREVFPEVFANFAGYPDTVDNSGNSIPGNSDLYTTASQALVCTNLYVSTWSLFGRDPDAFELSATGYSIPDGDHTIFAACDGHEERTPNLGA